MSQRTVSLGLQRIREFRVSLLVIHEGPERTLDFVMERDQERVAGDGIGATVEEELHHLAVPSEQHIPKWNGLNPCAVLDQHLDQVETSTFHGLSQGSVLLLLPRLVSGQQFNEAVEAGVDGCQKGRSLDRWVGDDRFPGRDPSIDIVEPTTAAKRKKSLRLVDSERGCHVEPSDTITHRGTGVVGSIGGASL